MDLLCDDVILEILLRLPLKYLHRLRAVSRRYDALVLGPGFSTRYWLCHGPHLSGVFLQTERLLRPWGHRPCFLAAPGRRRSPVLASDLAFMPRAQAAAIAAAAAAGRPTSTSIFLVHSTCGLLLCCRGEDSPTQYYVCNPVTWQCVALPELPSPPPPEHQPSSVGMLELAGDGHGVITSFRVVLVSHPSGWRRRGTMDLTVFSSSTGEWRALQLQLQAPSSDVYARHPTFHGQGSNAYWIGVDDRAGVQSKLFAMEYDSFYNYTGGAPMPAGVTEDGHNRCLGQRIINGGGSVRYAHFQAGVFEVWDLMSWRDQNGVCWPWWQLVHRIGVDELVRMNPVATGFLMKKRGANSEGVANLAKRDDLFHVLGFHPTEDDIVYFDVERSVAAYSMVSGAITLQSPRQCFSSDVFPYVHPPYPVMIPEIKKSKLSPEIKDDSKLAPSSELNHT